MKGFLAGVIGIAMILAANNAGNMYGDYDAHEVNHFYVEKTNEIMTDCKFLAESVVEGKAWNIGCHMKWLARDVYEVIVDYNGY